MADYRGIRSRNLWITANLDRKNLWITANLKRKNLWISAILDRKNLWITAKYLIFSLIFSYLFAGLFYGVDIRNDEPLRLERLVLMNVKQFVIVFYELCYN